MALNHFRLLGRSGLRVSPLCLGTMTFGEEWGWGSEKAESRRILDRYLEAGGNFIYTANYYTGGTSERFLGEFLKDRRQEVVLATKFTLNMRPGDPNGGGNHRKNIVQSLEASLKRLGTDYLDLYWLHAWDQVTPIEEVMRALDDQVRAGKVLHVGVSDMPAWKVAQANTLAELRGWSPFIALQVEYSLIERTVERELLPMARDLGLAVTPWSPLGSGILTGKYNKPAKGGEVKADRGDFVTERLTQHNLAIAETVVQVAAELGRTPSQVALRWLLQQPGVTSPILGARTLKQLEDNLACLEFELAPEQLARLDEASRVDLGFPMAFLGKEQIRSLITGGAILEEAA